MKVIITSGPMEMKIDNVRKIENTSTGALGVEFANRFADLGIDVCYIHTKKALIPTNEKIKYHQISDQNELLEILKSELPDSDFCIHAMAVSDFNYRGIINVEKLKLQLVEANNTLLTFDLIDNIINNAREYPEKLNSKNNNLLYLEQGIKVIDEIKKINPLIKLISFKLLANESEEQLIKIAQQQLQRTKSEYVVGNLMENVGADSHQAIIVNQEKVIARVNNKQQIVKEIISNLIKEKNNETNCISG